MSFAGLARFLSYSGHPTIFGPPCLVGHGHDENAPPFRDSLVPVTQCFSLSLSLALCPAASCFAVSVVVCVCMCVCVCVCVCTDIHPTIHPGSQSIPIQSRVGWAPGFTDQLYSFCARNPDPPPPPSPSPPKTPKPLAVVEEGPASHICSSCCSSSLLIFFLSPTSIYPIPSSVPLTCVLHPPSPPTSTHPKQNSLSHNLHNGCPGCSVPQDRCHLRR